MKTLNQKAVTGFQNLVYRYYNAHKRSFPWRETADPYAIFVSECMLQQTQTERVVPKYLAWMKRFPNVREAAQASLHEILACWQGLGYNRRGVNLHKALQVIVQYNEGTIPTSVEELQELPGVGPYTAAAIAAFAFNRPTVLLETNIRTVYIYYFCQATANKIPDSQLAPLVEHTLDRENPRQWYYALMDYGVMVKKLLGNFNRFSGSYSKQSRFMGSNRQKRGEILRQLTSRGTILVQDFPELINPEWQKPLEQLIKEGIVVRDGETIRIT